MTIQPRATRGRASLFVCVLLTIAFIDELFDGFWTAAWPLIRDDLALNYAQIGLMMSLPSLIACLIEPPLGLLADSGYRRTVILGGGLAFTAAITLLALAADYPMLLVGMILFYPASGAFVSTSQATLIDGNTTTNTQELLMARWVLAGSIGVVAGPLWLGLSSYISADGWRLGCLGIAASAFCMTIVAAFIWPHHTTTPETNSDHPSFHDAARDAYAALRKRTVWRWLLLLEASDLTLGIMPGFVALYFVDVVGMTPAEAGISVAITVTAALLGDGCTLPLLKRVDGLVWVRYSSLFALVMFTLFLATPTTWPWLKVAWLALMSFASAGWYAILKARLYQAMPDRSGTVLAVSSTFGLLMSWIPGTVGLLALTIGLEATFAVLALGPILLWIGLPKHAT